MKSYPPYHKGKHASHQLLTTIAEALEFLMFEELLHCPPQWLGNEAFLVANLYTYPTIYLAQNGFAVPFLYPS